MQSFQVFYPNTKPQINQDILQDALISMQSTTILYYVP